MFQSIKAICKIQITILDTLSSKTKSHDFKGLLKSPIFLANMLVENENHITYVR